MPFIRGLVFSSSLLDGCPALLEQLQLLHWGGLHVAVLRSETTGSRDVAPPAAATTAATCENVECLQLPPPSTPGGAEVGSDGDGGRMATAAAAEAAASSWAASHGLQWPAEVVVVGAPADEAGLLRRLLRQQQPEAPEGTVAAAAAGELPGFSLEDEESVKAAPWPRLRLALAHANLRRAEEAAAGEGAEGAAGGPPGCACPGPLVVVGYTMKASRERDLAKEGLLNLVPKDGMVFAPLDLSLPLEGQLPFHALLHKASDELEYGSDGVPRFGPRVRAMADFASRHPGVSLVDPLEAAAKVINRTELARVCDSLSLVDLGRSVEPGPGGEDEDGGDEGGGEGGGAPAGAPPAAKLRRVGPPVALVRAPRSTTVTSFTAEEVQAAGERLGCPPPYIVKPVVACGTPDSHLMALVLLPEALEGLSLPLPAVIQEFINHDAIIYKVYVAGEKVFHTVRPSIPNVPRSRPQALQVAPSGLLHFDSLKSLPTTLGSDPAAAPLERPRQPAAPSQVVLERLAAHLRRELGLSLFGFDVVIASTRSSSSGVGVGGDGGGVGVGGDGGGVGGDGVGGHSTGGTEVVVVDVNYFPSYRGAEGAPQLFRAAVMAVYVRQQAPRRGVQT